MPTYSGIWTPAQLVQQVGPGFWPGVTQPGQQVYSGNYSYSRGSSMYTWVCPPGVTSVSVCCVGSGGNGNAGYNATTTGAGGGGGGGLGWKNNIPVTPGVGYTVAAGDLNYNAGSAAQQENGAISYFISSGTVSGGGGYGNITRTGGSYTGDGGGNGGTGGSGYNGYPSGPYSETVGAGGAGGYTGNGGNGGSTGSAGSGGGGGGGGGGYYNFSAPYYPGGGGGGGGVGLTGQGADGAFSTGGAGGYYGGGGASGWSPAYGNIGAVRIMWQGPVPGTPRSYPSNAGNL